ncbi:zinc-dependent alcohol dehydrogenase family protein [Candidatus Obscuribacterales bacterium]|nr:zinc-dependent alcohol dehydrogenase family protein [Candidatus Obscuribacterales bacterium]MBX3149582.1 zinc-dependent alcohol dehydrogenase family protein [Candidatus Obscuribacterales bacterium]
MPKIIKLHALGGVEELRVEDVEPQEPGPGEVRIKVKAIGLNRAEVLFRQGMYLEMPKLPSRIGYEASGYVDKVGSGVNEFKVGEYVSTIPAFAMSQYGVYGEEAVVPARALSHVPASLTPAEAASVWMQYLTAGGALVEIGKLQHGQFVVVTAGSSSVGLAAIQVIKDAGAISILTTRTAKKKQALLDAGADHVIVTDDEKLSERVMQITNNKGADIIFDSVAGALITELAKCAKLEAQIIIYGALSLETTPLPFKLALKKGLIIRGYTMHLVTDDDDRYARMRKYITERLESGVFKPVVDSRLFDLEHLGESHTYMESNQQLGKVVVLVD